MNKAKFNIKYHCAIIVMLIFLLGITMSYGWYTVVKDVHTNEIFGYSGTESIALDNYAIFKDDSLNSPIPDKYDRVAKIDKLLPGEKVYYSVRLVSHKDFTCNIDIDITGIDGGEFFYKEVNGDKKYYYTTDPSGNIKYYNMSDLFQIKLNSIWINNEIWLSDTVTPEGFDLSNITTGNDSISYDDERILSNEFTTDESGNLLSVPSSITLLKINNLSVKKDDKIAFVFELSFSSKNLPHVTYEDAPENTSITIPFNCYGNKTLVFGNISLYGFEDENTKTEATS